MEGERGEPDNLERLSRLKESPRLKGESWTYFEDWISKLNPSTQEKYLRQFIQFLDYLDVDTESFFAQYKELTEDPDPRKKKRMGMRVTQFQRHLARTEGIKLGSTLDVYRSVKGFFTANELDFEINGDRIKDDSDELPSISKEQIVGVLEATGSYRNKAMVHFAKDSGLRVGDITALTVGDIRPIWDNPNFEQVEGYPGFYTFTVTQEKTDRNADPCIGPETTEALQLWKSERRDLGISDNDSDPLFCAIKTVTPFVDKRGREIRGSTKGDRLDESTLSVIFSQLVRKAKLGPLQGEKRRPSIHSLRKYHKTNLEYGSCPTSWVNKLQGRKGEGTGGTYTKPNTQQLIEIYAKAYPALALSRTEQVKAVNGIREDLEVYRRDATAFQEMWEQSEKEKDNMRAELDEVKKMLKAIMEKQGGF